MKENALLFPNVHAELARAGLTASMIADFMGVSRQAIYGKLNGRVSITLKDMEQIQKFFKAKGCGTFTLDYLFKNDG